MTLSTASEARVPTTSTPAVGARTAAERLHAALHDPDPETALASLGEPGAPARVDRLRCLRLCYDLHLCRFGEGSWLQHHPVVAQWKRVLERQWLDELAVEDRHHRATLPVEPIAAMRALAARDRLPAVYTWVARSADLPQIAQFLALEGGPDDDGFDDVVAICQLGLPSPAKTELARNYWEEMGSGDPTAVHGHLYARFANAIGLRSVDDDTALARKVLTGMLATNRALQPEMLGALGLIELQAGPRSRLVSQGLRRVGAPAATLPFYDVHAEVDPRHGKDWLEQAIEPVVAARPGLGDRIVRGAMWRARANGELFEGPTVAALISNGEAGGSS
jgi:hypothetical protein